MTSDFRCGFATIVGRPNVGKSTLLNHLVGQKISITAAKPQTTRHRIGGVLTRDDCQIVFVDTPGIHFGRSSALNRYLNRTARGATSGVDVVVLMVEALRWTPEDERIRRGLRGEGKKGESRQGQPETGKGKGPPVLLAPNKVDRFGDKTALLPWLDQFRDADDFEDIIPISARRGANVDALVGWVRERLPAGPAIFPEDMVTDRSESFLASELIREKLTRKLDQELPYRLTVGIDGFRREKKIIHIDAIIRVERESQKGIVIGKGGRVLKAVGREARANMEVLFGEKVHLRLWVKIDPGWSDDEKLLPRLGYDG